MNIKPTTAEMTIFHLFISALAAALIGALSMYIQFYTAHGQDLWVTLAFIGASFPVVFGGIRASVFNAIRTSPALKQASQDFGQQALTEVRTLAANVQPLFTHTHASPSQPAQPAPIVSRAVTTPAARPPQAIPFPPPQSTPVAHFGETGVQAAVMPPSA